MNYGFRRLESNTRIENVISLVYGVVCYLCLIFQFGFLFYFFYLTLPDGGGVLPPQAMQLLQSGEWLQNDDAFEAMTKPLFGYVLPIFYRFPSNVGPIPVMQFYIGKFVDLFILAYMVEQIRRRTGLK